MKRVFRDIENERARQDKKWGEQNHGPHRWLGILMEEVGEASKVMLAHSYAASLTELVVVAPDLEEFVALESGVELLMREELIQAAAVLVAWIECIDRRQAEKEEEQ